MAMPQGHTLTTNTPFVSYVWPCTYIEPQGHTLIAINMQENWAYGSKDKKAGQVCYCNTINSVVMMYISILSLQSVMMMILPTLSFPHAKNWTQTRYVTWGRIDLSQYTVFPAYRVYCWAY